MTWKDEIRKFKQGPRQQYAYYDNRKGANNPPEVEEAYKKYQKEQLDNLKEMERLAAKMKYSFFEIMEDLNVPEDKWKKQAFAKFLEDMADLTEALADSIEPASSDVSPFPDRAEEPQRMAEVRSNLRSSANRKREMAGSARTRASDLRR